MWNGWGRWYPRAIGAVVWVWDSAAGLVQDLVASAFFEPCANHHASAGKGELANLFCASTSKTYCASCAGGRDVVQVRSRPLPAPDFSRVA